jgi:hypothetical protein
MRTFFHSLLLIAPLCAGLWAAEDCAKSADACSGGSAKLSPFAAASLRENLPPAPAPAKAKRAIMREAPAAAAPAVAAQPAAAAPQAVTPDAQDAPDVKRPLSSPLWLFFVGGVLAMLYFYLAAGRRKGKRR